MGFGISLPSLSDIRNTVTNTVTSATDTVRDLGSSALQHTVDLGRSGLDLGRRAVDAVRSVDVRDAASFVRGKIGEGTEAARNGIKTGVEWAGQETHKAADLARDHVPGGDNFVSNGIRGAITLGEDTTRFQLGVVGGVTREVVGLAGTVGELGTTLTEMQLSTEASAEYGQKILDGAKGAAEATGGYLSSVAHDPSRVGSDIGNVADAGEKWAGGQIDRYQQAFRDGKGFETVGMDVGTVSTYVVPIGGGPVRGALTAAVRGGTEAVVRGGTEAVVRGFGEATVRETSGAVAGGARATEGVAATGRTLEQMGTQLRDVARTEMQRLRAEEGLSNKTLGPAVSVVMDRQTGAISRIYRNDFAGKLPEHLNPTLADRLGGAREIDYIKTRGAGTHSEIYAANELLNHGSRIEDLVVYTEQIGGKHAGGVKPPCPHCSSLLDGVTYAE